MPRMNKQLKQITIQTRIKMKSTHFNVRNSHLAIYNFTCVSAKYTPSDNTNFRHKEGNSPSFYTKRVTISPLPAYIMYKISDLSSQSSDMKEAADINHFRADLEE